MHKLVNPICHKEELAKLWTESTVTAYTKKKKKNKDGFRLWHKTDRIKYQILLCLIG